jgi:hypothetical protein
MDSVMSAECNISHDLLAMWDAFQRLRAVWTSVANPDPIFNDQMVDILSQTPRLDDGRQFAFFVCHCKNMMRDFPP